MNGLIGRSRSSAGRETRLSASRWSASTAARSPAPSAPGSLPWFRAEGRDAGEVQAGGIPRACEHAEGADAARCASPESKPGEQVHATLNIAVWQGEGSAPLRPPWGFRASVGAAEGGVRLRNLVPGRGDGRPAAVGEAAISHRGEPVARDPCAPRRRLSGGRGGEAPRQPPCGHTGYAGSPTLAWLSQPGGAA